MELGNAGQTAALEAIAIVDLIIRNEGDGSAAILATETEDPAALVRAACGLAGALLMGLAPGREEWFLNQYRQLALGRPAGGS